jgi:putative ATPase
LDFADPARGGVAELAAATYDRLGSPEGELALGQAVFYMAMAAKSYRGKVALQRSKRLS